MTGQDQLGREPSPTPAAARHRPFPHTAHAAPATARHRHDNSSWPPVQWEEHTWTLPAVSGPRSHRDLHPHRYSAAVPPRIAHLTPNPSRRSLTLATRAAFTLTEFDTEMGERAHDLAPLLLHVEAICSSRIENLTASARAVLSAEMGARAPRHAGEINANTRAMQVALDRSEDITADTVTAIHATLMEGQTRHTPGRCREEAVWVGTQVDSPVGAEYVAPHHTLVPELIENLVTFTRRTDIPAVVSIALAHAQFETIHPFTDGNGRTGRALAQAMLRHLGVTRAAPVPLSGGLLTDVDGYYAALTAYRAGDIDPIVEVFANASLRAVDNARQLVEDIDRIRADWQDRLPVPRNSNAWRMLNLIARRPVLTPGAAAVEVGIPALDVRETLRDLRTAGILRTQQEYRLGLFFRSPEILAAVDALVESARLSGRQPTVEVVGETTEQCR